MALETLKKEISDRTALLKFPRSETVSRIFYVIVSPSMNHLKDWFQEWFPIIDNNLKKIYPWITFNENPEGSKDISDVVSNAFFEVFNIETTNMLTANGYHIIDTANQIMLVGDLTEEGIGERLESVHGLFKEVINKFSAYKAPVYFTGLFLLSNIDKKDESGKTIVKNIVDFGKVSGWIQKNLNKVFLVDISNPCGTVVSKSRDLHFFLGQLIYILTRKPIEFAITGGPVEFGEWITRDGTADGRCTGFSGISILSPVDQILETLLVSKGGEVLEETFWGKFEDERVNLYLLSLINKTFLNSQEVFKRMLVNNKLYSLIDPFTEQKEEQSKNSSMWNLNKPEDFIAYMDALDAELPDKAAENRRIMEVLGEKLLEEFRYNLLEHLNAAITNEKGGIVIAKTFLEKLKEHLKSMIPEEPSPFLYPDITSLIRELENKIKQGPRKEAVTARTLLLSLTASLGVFSSQATFDIPFILFSVLAVISAGGGVLYWHAYKNSLERLVINIQKNLQNKWMKLMNKEITEVMIASLPKYLFIVDDMIKQVEDASKRLYEVINYFKNDYMAPVPQSSAFWIYTVNRRDEIEKYSDMIRFDTPTVASDYLLKEKPLELWKRVSPLGTSEPNSWEWSLVEKAALGLFPFSQEVIELSVCRILRDSPEKADNFAEVLKRSAEPFLVMKPGKTHCITRGGFEVPVEGCEDVYNKLENSIRGNFSQIEKHDSRTPYRISLFSTVEGIEFESIKVEG